MFVIWSLPAALLRLHPLSLHRRSNGSTAGGGRRLIIFVLRARQLPHTRPVTMTTDSKTLSDSKKQQKLKSISCCSGSSLWIKSHQKHADAIFFFFFFCGCSLWSEFDLFVAETSSTFTCPLDDAWRPETQTLRFSNSVQVTWCHRMLDFTVLLWL